MAEKQSKATVTWHELPFVRIALAFIAGILLQQATGSLLTIYSGTALFLISAGVMLWMRNPLLIQRMRLLILLALAGTVGAFVRWNVEPGLQDVIRATEYQGIVEGVVRHTGRTASGVRAEVRVVTPRPASGRLRAVIYIRNAEMMILPGDTLRVGGGLQEIRPRSGPYAFDLRKYFARQGVYLNAFVSEEDLRIAPGRYLIHLRRSSAHARNFVTRIFERHVNNPENLGVLLALTIGVREGLNEELRTAYARAGTIHVLAISGLHVGIVSSLLYFLIGRPRPNDKAPLKIARAVIMTGGIWAFAFIAGLSPSVTRAALMFSVYLIGISMHRSVRGLNIMAFAAFVTLSIDPLQINSVSFQFSYLALAGILIFFQPVYRLIPIQRGPGKFIWGIMAVSIAAQILLFPLLIHYFQQVSLVSPVASVLAIPAAYFLLVGGFLLFVLDQLWSPIASLAGWLLDAMMDIINGMMVGIAGLPFSHIGDIHLPAGEAVILYAVFLSLALRMLTAQPVWTWVSATSACLFVLTHALAVHRSADIQAVAVYPVQGLPAVDVITGRQCRTSFDIETLSSWQAHEVRALRRAYRVPRNQIHQTPLKNPADTGHIHLIEIHKVSKGKETADTLHIMIITGIQDHSELNLLHEVSADWVILAPDAPFALRRAVYRFCEESGSPLHDLRTDGMFYMTNSIKQ